MILEREKINRKTSFERSPRSSRTLKLLEEWVWRARLPDRVDDAPEVINVRVVDVPSVRDAVQDACGAGPICLKKRQYPFQAVQRRYPKTTDVETEIVDVGLVVVEYPTY